MTQRWTAAVLAVVALGIVIVATSPDASGDHGDHTPVIVIGDSIVYDGYTNFAEEFAAADLDNVLIDAQGGRSIDQSGMAPWGWIVSGVERISTLRAAGADAPVWIIELGANNLPRLEACGCDQAVEARRLIDLIRSLLPDRELVWVTTRYETHHEASLVFNEALWQVAREDARFHVVDWYTYSAGQDWFIDAVHANHTGSHALARCVARVGHMIHDLVWGVTPTTTTTTTTLPAQPVPGITLGQPSTGAVRLGHTGRDLPACPVL